MAIMVRTCCCGCDLKTGILLIGILGLLSSGYGIYSGIHNVKILNEFKDDVREVKVDSPISYKYYKVVINLGYAEIGFSVLSLLTCGLLLGSYCTRNRFLTLPYIMYQIFALLYTLGVTIFLISIWSGFSYVFAIKIIDWLLLIYFIIVVYSYHESLREDPSGATAGFIDGAGVHRTVMVQVAGPPPYAKFP